MTAPNTMERWSNRNLWRLVWPLIIEQLLALTIGMADTAMVTKAGENAVSGVALVDSINMLIIMVFTALATGGAVVASQYIGARNPEKASLAARQLVYTTTALSVLLMVVVLFLRQPILNLIFGNIEPEVMANAEVYFWLSALSYPFIALYNAGAALFRSMGNSRIGMATALLINVINVGGNALLIFGFGLGAAGAAISTLLSRIVAGVLIIKLLVNGRFGALSLKGLFKFKLDKTMISSILKIGVPNGIENSMFQIGKLIMARMVAGFGTAAIAGNAIAGVVASFGNLPGQAAGLAMLTVVGQCVGSGDYKGAKTYTSKLMKFAFAGVAVVNALLFFNMKTVLSVFNLSAQALAVAMACLTLYHPADVLLWPQSFALPNALRAAGDARYTMVVSMFSMWTFRIGLSYYFAAVLGFGVLGVWMGMVVDWIVRGSFFMYRWHSNKWQKGSLVKKI